MDHNPELSLPSPSEVRQVESSTPGSSKKQLVRLLKVAIIFALALSVGYLIGNLAKSDVSWGLSSWQRLGIFLGIILPLPLILAIHEGGHLLGGKIAGFKFSLFIVGPLMISRRKQGIKISLNKSLAMYGGLAASMPTDTHNLRRGMLWLVAGGPVMSILFGALLIGLRMIFLPDQARPETHSVFDLFLRLELMVLGIASIGIGCLTLFPGKTGGFLTDGARLKLLLQGGPQADREKTIWLITTQSMAGTRPRDWDPALLKEALILEDGSPFEYGTRMLAYNHAIDTQNCQDAHHHLLRCLTLWNQLPPPIHPILAREAAYFEATCHNDASAARAWLDATQAGPFVDDISNARTEAAVLIAEGHWEQAASKAKTLNAATKNTLDIGMAIAQEDWVKQLFAQKPADSFLA